VKFVNIFFIVFFLLLIPVDSNDDSPKGKIIIKVVNLRSNKGNVRSQLYNDPNYFPTNTDGAIKKTLGKIVNKESIIIFDNLNYGDYAVTVHHDEDLDGWMNKNILGLPSEGWGISKNPIVIVSLPSFDEAKIKLNSAITRIIIEMK
jgi:uncharacterized protein (DUF2141 family)